jgi:hypothetical protein
MSRQQEIGREEKKLAAIAAEKEQTYENNSAARAIEKAQQMSWNGLERSLTKASSMTRKQHNTTTPIIKQRGGYESTTAADSGNNVDGFSDLPATIFIFVVVFYSAPISLSVY